MYFSQYEEFFLLKSGDQPIVNRRKYSLSFASVAFGATDIRNALVAAAVTRVVTPHVISLGL